MSTTLQLRAAPHRVAPRAAEWLGTRFARLLNSINQPRQPQPHDLRMNVRQAREMAALWAEFDPRSAADLRAAADRFEQEHELA